MSNVIETCSKLIIEDACLGTNRNTVVGTYTLIDQSTYPCQRTNNNNNVTDISSPIYIRHGFLFNDILFYNPTYNSWWITEERWYCSNDNYSRAEFAGDTFSPLSSTANTVLCWNTTNFDPVEENVQVTTDFTITCSDNDNTIPRYADISSVCDDFKEQDFVEIYRRDCRDSGTFEGFLIRCKNGVFDGMDRDPILCTDLAKNPNYSFCHRCEDDIQGASVVCADTSNTNTACTTIAKGEDECISGFSGYSVSTPCTSDTDYAVTERLCNSPSTNTEIFSVSCAEESPEAPICGNSCFGFELCSSSKIEGCSWWDNPEGGNGFIPTNSPNENNNQVSVRSEDSSSSGLAIGAIIGIVIAGVFVIALCVVVCVLVMVCKRKNSSAAGTRSNNNDKNDQDEYNNVEENQNTYNYNNMNQNNNGERKMATTVNNDNVPPPPPPAAEIVEAVPMHNPDYVPQYKDQTRTVVTTGTVSTSIPSASTTSSNHATSNTGTMVAEPVTTYSVEVQRRPDP